MIKIKERTLLLIIVGALFLWISFLYINFYSDKSDATTPAPVQIGFSTDKLVLQKNQPVSIDIYMNSNAPISGATISLLYPADIFEYQDPKDTSSVSRGCSTYPMLKSFVAGKVNTDGGYVSVTRVSIDKTENLPKGYFCFGTVSFVPKADITLPAAGVFKLDSSIGTWQVTGPQNSSYASVIIPEKSKLVVSIDGLCSMKTRGDANCDGVIDLGDFELWRKSYTNRDRYSEAADFDGDKRNTVKDFEIWRQGFYDATEPTPTPTATCIIPTPYCVEPNGPCTVPVPPTGGWCPSPTPTCIPLPSCAMPNGDMIYCSGNTPALSPGQRYCGISPTPIIIDECTWCGNSCVNGPLPPDQLCPMVMPAPGLSCQRVNGICTPVKTSPTPTPQVLCRWCGSICTSSTNLIACPSITPPAGTTCIQVQDGCQIVSQ